MRKNEEPHYIFVQFKNEAGESVVSSAHCSYKAGSGRHCNHVIALLFQVNDLGFVNVYKNDVTGLYWPGQICFFFLKLDEMVP